MEKLKGKLSSKYFEMSEYFNESFIFMEYFLKKEKMWGIIFLMLFGISEIGIKFNSNIQNLLFGILQVMAVIYSMLATKKIMETIEEKKRINNFIFFIKLIILTIIVTVFVLFPLIFQMVIHKGLMENILMIFSRVLPVYLFFMLFSIYYLMYFEIMYLTRKVNIIDAFKYNLHLSKGNRLRKFIPMLLMTMLTLIVTFILSNINLIFSYIPIIGYIFAFIKGIISGMILLYSTSVESLIYLNVEYMDLKKSNIENNEIENNVLVRKTKEEDVEKILEIFEKAKIKMKNMNIDQWQKGYPNREVILKDIENDISYVLEDNGEIIGTAVLSFDKENTYEKMEEGKWLTNGDYGVIHRISINDECRDRGYGTTLLKKLEEICIKKGIMSIKIDTHEDNIPMREYLKKNGFELCGVIYLENGEEKGSKRITLEKILNKTENL